MERSWIFTFGFLHCRPKLIAFLARNRYYAVSGHGQPAGNPQA
jgi:hypothetical protein